MKTLVEYKFNDTTVTSTDGNLPIAFSGASVIAGPGKTSMGQYDKAVDLGTAGRASVAVGTLSPDRGRFCIDICFKATQKVKARQNLVESDFLPFAVTLDKGSTPNKFIVSSTLNNAAGGWHGPSNRFKTELGIGKWYVVTLAYDADTAALFVDGTIVGVYAFPKGALAAASNHKKLFFGTWVDGARNHFTKGQFAGFTWRDGIPDAMQSVIDDQRSQSEWFITRKYESERTRINFGAPEKGIRFNRATGAHTQFYERGLIMYHDSIGAAFEMHGAIYSFYKGWRNNDELGYLVIDESDTTRRGGRKSLFSKGGIYYSGATGAVPVSGQLYVDYEGLGESAVLGFPKSRATSVAGGSEQIFQNARMYHRSGQPHAFEVHGAILAKFLALGGVRKWGFPVTNESDVIGKNKKVEGKFSEFEGCTIFWSGPTGAFEVHGDIRKKYMELSGPIGDLGFPTSDEADIPNYSGTGRMNTFKKGSILWYGSYGSIIVALPFKLYLGRLSTKESEGFLRGQNDLYVRAYVFKNGGQILNDRMPNHGSWSNNNSKNLNHTIAIEFVPNERNLKIEFRLKAWDDDGSLNANDYLGQVSETLSAANGWGLRDNHGTHTLKSGKIKSLQLTVKPQIDPNTLTDTQKWWGVHNQSTNVISWQTHAEAFRDVDSETEWWDVTDWVDKAFYAAVTKKIAAGGNCFGMSLESIYARKCNSIFNLPICQYDDWNGIKHEINVKHLYQAGAGAVYWFLGQFLSGNTHDPVDVFKRTRNAFHRGDNPVLCIAQHYDFSGAPHAIVPVAWNDSVTPWEMTICDPNSQARSCAATENATRILKVDPHHNTFDYLGRYSGGEWSGGRMHYIPFGVLNHRPRTPVWDLILLLIAGTIIIVGDDAQTASVTDENGNDLSAFGEKAAAELKAGREPDAYFYGFKGFDRSAETGPGNILIRKDFDAASAPGAAGSVMALPVSAALGSVRTPVVLNATTALRRNTTLTSALHNRTPHAVAADPAIMATLSPDVKKAINAVVNANAKRNFIHNVKGRVKGSFDYLFKHQFTEVKVESGLDKNEVMGISMRDIGSSRHTMRIDAAKNKNAKITVTNKLGLHGDFIRLTLDHVAVGRNKSVQLALKPGLGDIELIAPAQAGNISVKLEAKIQGVPVTRSVSMPSIGGARMRVSSLLEEKTLHYFEIDRLFGVPFKAMKIR